MSGTSNGIIDDFNGTLWTQESYFNYLRRNNRTFAGYYQEDPWALFYFHDTNIPPNVNYMHEMDPYFFEDVYAGRLPHFTWLQPQMNAHKSPPNWQHPDASVIEGERLIKRIYEALRRGPQWNNTLFLITYGEFPFHSQPNMSTNSFLFERRARR